MDQISLNEENTCFIKSFISLSIYVSTLYWYLVGIFYEKNHDQPSFSLFIIEC